MKHILDPGTLWLGQPGRLLAPGNKRPVTLPDTASVVKDGGTVSITVLANDFDPEGQPVTLVSASAALGTAVAELDGTVSYTPPPGLTGTDTVTYEIADDLDQRRTGQVTVTITEPALSVAATPSNTLVVDADTGLIDITVTEPTDFVGTYQANTSDLASGPVNLVPPAIAGVAAEGETLSATEGLWIHDTAGGTPAQIWQWHRNAAAIPGATLQTYALTAADIGQQITAVEGLSDSMGQRFAESAPLGGAFTPANDTALIGWWDADDAATITHTAGEVSSWTDKAGGTALAQATTFRQPLTGSRTLNGLNVIDFTGSDFLNSARTLPASGDVAFHMALAIDSTVSQYEAVLAVDATNDFQIDAASDIQFDGRLNVAGIGTSAAFTGGPFTGAFILSVVFDRTTAGMAEVFVSGISRASMVYTQPLDTAVQLIAMANRSTNAWVDGAMAEMIITGDIGNRAQHHAYLAAKWGLA